MTHGKRIRTGLGIVAAMLVVAAPAGAATKITVIRDVSARDASVLSAMPIQVVRDVSARDTAARASVTPIQVVRDVSARDARLAAGEAAIAYFKANEGSTLVDSAGPAAIAYFRANERATMKDDGEAVAATSKSGLAAARAGGFDWADAGVGASSALLLALLVGVSLLAARHLRSSPVLR
jgi:hypothetical protein